jgi:hypothetical protein
MCSAHRDFRVDVAAMLGDETGDILMHPRVLSEISLENECLTREDFGGGWRRGGDTRHF